MGSETAAEWFSAIATFLSTVLAWILAVRKKVPDVRFSLSEKSNEKGNEWWLRVYNYDQVAVHLSFFKGMQNIDKDMYLNPFDHRVGHLVEGSFELNLNNSDGKQAFKVVDSVSNHCFYIKIIIDDEQGTVFRYCSIFNHKIWIFKRRESKVKLHDEWYKKLRFNGKNIQKLYSNHKFLDVVIIVLITTLIGNGVVFFLLSFVSNKYGTLADWLSGLGTVAALMFVYFQINEQRKEFDETTRIELSITVVFANHIEELGNSVRTLSERIDIHVWAANSGMRPSSFKFLGFCNIADFEKIESDSSVIYDPQIPLLKPEINNFQLLQPGQVSKEEIRDLKSVIDGLGNPLSFYVVYMNATGELFKSEIKNRMRENSRGNSY